MFFLFLDVFERFLFLVSVRFYVFGHLNNPKDVNHHIDSMLIAELGNLKRELYPSNVLLFLLNLLREDQIDSSLLFSKIEERRMVWYLFY